MKIMIHNNILEIIFAAAALFLKAGGTIRTDHSYTNGQTQINKDFDRVHLVMVTGPTSQVEGIAH